MAAAWIDHLWRTGTGLLSWQVILKYCANAPRKTGMLEARARAEDLFAWNPEPPHEATLQRAWHWCDTAHLNFWDAMIVAAAEQSGARYLLTEDLQADRKFGNVIVRNPFTQPLPEPTL